jgi:hypothetical protein
MGHRNEVWDEEQNPKSSSKSAKASGGKKGDSSKKRDRSQKGSDGPLRDSKG